MISELTGFRIVVFVPSCISAMLDANMWWSFLSCVTSLLWGEFCSHDKVRGRMSFVGLDWLHLYPRICQTYVDTLRGWSTLPRQAWACINRCLRSMVDFSLPAFLSSLSMVNFPIESMANPSLSSHFWTCYFTGCFECGLNLLSFL